MSIDNCKVVFCYAFIYSFFMDVGKPITSAAPADGIADLSSAEAFRKFIEVEVLKIIKNSAEKESMPQERMQYIAQLTLDLIRPGMSLEELYKNAIMLDDQCSELAPIVLKVMKEYEEKYEKQALQIVSHLVKKGQYDQAQEMVKKVLQFKIVN